jgi:hypothetical protein
VAEASSRSVEKAVLWIGAALILLLVGFVSFTVLRPQVTEGDGGGSWGIVAETGQVITQVSIEAGWASWGGFELVAVDDVPGAAVAGAWLLTASERDRLPADPLSEAFLDLDLDEAALPRRLGHQERADLIVLWDITDCSALVERRRPEVVLHNLVGFSVRRRLAQEVAAPSFDLTVLADAGICPTR